PGNITKKFICKETGLLACETCTNKAMQSFKRGFEPEAMCTHGTDDEGIDNYFAKQDGIKNVVDYTESETDESAESGEEIVVETEDAGAFDPGAPADAAAKKQMASAKLGGLPLETDEIEDEITADGDE
ncbi:MAG TPA: hypothetical protein PKW98_12395, partial [Candidatus Wallbacteria bacterium]|nr:hypothetical protein [Candidatus Wallbacteria bacterium]